MDVSNSFYIVVSQIISKANTEDLMLLYSLPAFAKGDANAFLSGVARANHLVKKVSVELFFIIYPLMWSTVNVINV